MEFEILVKGFTPYFQAFKVHGVQREKQVNFEQKKSRVNGGITYVSVIFLSNKPDFLYSD